MRLDRARLVRLGLGAIVLYLVLCALAGAVLGEGALRPSRRAVGADVVQKAADLARRQHARMESVAITATSDGAELRGWLFTPPAPNGQAVIVLHGVGDTRNGALGNAEVPLSAGYTVLTPDARGHGDSGGAFTTYGIVERQDIRQWAEALRTRGVRGCIHGIGVSMGAAELLQAIGPPDAFCSAVAEGSFSTFREVAFDRMGQRVGTGPWIGRTLLRPVVEIGLWITRLRYGVELTDASPLAVLSSTHTPVLLIHGDEDTNIPPRHADVLRAGNPAMVTFWSPAHVRHGRARVTYPDEYRSRVLAFLAAHTPAASLAAH